MQEKNKNLKETELYYPIKTFFENKGYLVRSEVKNCDITCTLENKLTIIEMKKSFTLKLLYQALERKKTAEFVFIAIERPKNFRKKEVSHMLKILKALDIGLITVSLNSTLKNVQIVCEPKKQNKPTSLRNRKSILNEIEKRDKDFNLGGSSSKDLIITSYRENSIQIACFLKELKQASPSQLVSLGCAKNTGDILRGNYYNWFKKVSRGVYTLSKVGKIIFLENKFKNVINHYEMEVKKCLKLKEMKNVGVEVEKNTNFATKETTKKS